MKKYRCPKCKTVFEKRVPRCPNCGQELHYLDELNAPKAKEEPAAENPNETTHFDFEEAEKEKEEALNPIENPVVTAAPVAPEGEKTDWQMDVSYFDGRLLQKWGWIFLGILLTIVTLGFGFPWAVCLVYRWEARHTVIDGHRMDFDGKGGQLFGRYLLWLFLIIITFTLFTFWVALYLQKWKNKHTHFAEALQKKREQNL